MNKKILVSGIKPTGNLHLGNYFGAMKQFVEMQNFGEYNPFVFLADYHALNSIQNREEMKKLSFDLICAYLAVGLDPQNDSLQTVILFQNTQSLLGFFNTLVSMPWLVALMLLKVQKLKIKK
ncbi:MAG: hypothetical protein R3B39_00940 [Candidatus Paceibacterota bacterium]